MLLLPSTTCTRGPCHEHTSISSRTECVSIVFVEERSVSHLEQGAHGQQDGLVVVARGVVDIVLLQELAHGLAVAPDCVRLPAMLRTPAKE
jgi:hypothetical protein